MRERDTLQTCSSKEKVTVFNADGVCGNGGFSTYSDPEYNRAVNRNRCSSKVP